MQPYRLKKNKEKKKQLYYKDQGTRQTDLGETVEKVKATCYMWHGTLNAPSV